MGVFSKLRLFSECYKLAGITGVVACIKYLFGVLSLDYLDVKNPVFIGGVSDV